ncbi:MAG TPA: putative metal-binding motif-containing protein, partial [Polyangiaceae bacterium]
MKSNQLGLRLVLRDAWIAGIVFAAACGGRTPLRPGLEGDGGAAGTPPVACTLDSECGAADACRTPLCDAGTCREVLVDCDDGDACTEDLCEPALGCSSRKLTLDADGDGYFGPRPGFIPGTPEACGNDCDDSSVSVFPGNRELCDGLDNDCNGIKDDGVSEYVPLLAERRLSGPGDARSSVGGLTATSTQFVVSYSARRGTRRQNLLALLDPNLRTVTETQITQLNTDA